jgi:hypothetical protein
MPFLSEEADERKIATVSTIKRIPQCDCGQEFKNRIDCGRGQTMYPVGISGSYRNAEFKTSYKCRICGERWEA